MYEDDNEEEPTVLAQVPAVMITDMFISRAEEDYMGIAEQETSNHRSKYNLLKSDGFEEAQQAGKWDSDRSATQ
jgi:hypothetical protein